MTRRHGPSPTRDGSRPQCAHALLEQRHLVGGAAITEELRPGFWFTTFSYALSLLRPQIVQELSGLSDFTVSMISALPYVAAAIGMIAIGTSSDRTGERLLHVAIPSAIGALGFVASAYFASPLPAMIALTIAAVGDLGTRGAFWALPTKFLTGGAAATGIALINTMASLGGFVGPSMVGFVREYTGSFAGGLVFLAVLLLLAAAAAVWLRGARALAD